MGNNKSNMIRPFESKDYPLLLHLLELNSPEYFAPSEKEDFIDYLKNEREQYFIYEENGEIIGAGGINFFPDENTARISWDMVHPEHHGKGIGGQLTKHRINVIKNLELYKIIVVRTSQLAYRFYGKMGFELEKIERDFWAKGFDLYQMKMILPL